MTLEPLPGTIKKYVFENEFLYIPPTLVYDIDLPMRPFEYEGEVQHTLVRLSRIRFDVVDWDELSGREFHFPINPVGGYINGSMYLGSAYNPADVTRIKFGTLVANQLTAVIDIKFDFEYECLDALGKPHFTWQVVLNLDLVTEAQPNATADGVDT